jgi:hypothetical protein
LTTLIKNHPQFKNEVDWADLDDFNAEKNVKLIERFMNEILYPKLDKAFLDPVGHTSFGAKELRQAWLNCRHIDWYVMIIIVFGGLNRFSFCKFLFFPLGPDLLRKNKKITIRYFE